MRIGYAILFCEIGATLVSVQAKKKIPVSFGEDGRVHADSTSEEEEEEISMMR